jgi:transposase
MRFVGIDVAAERHVVAAVDETSAVRLQPTPFAEDLEGYQKLLGLLGDPGDTLVAMEATGHYWKNLFAALVAHGFSVALLNPLRTRRFAGEELQRTQTDAIDALGIARFAAQKRPAVTRLPDPATEELRELVRYRDRLVQDFGDRVRQLHRLVDLGFPEFLRYVRDLGSELATAVLRDYPTAAAFRGVSLRHLASLRYDGRHKVGDELATALLDAAPRSVGRHHGEAYRIQVRDACEDLDLLRRRLRSLERDIARLLDHHEVGTLLTTIEGIGPQTAARLVATFGPFQRRPQRRRPGVLRRRRSCPAPVRQAHLEPRRPDAHRRGLLAREALDACPYRRPEEPLAARLRRGPRRPREASEGRPHRRAAEAAPRRLQRGHASSSLRPPPARAGGALVKKGLDRRHGISQEGPPGSRRGARPVHIALQRGGRCQRRGWTEALLRATARGE